MKYNHIKIILKTTLLAFAKKYSCRFFLRKSRKTPISTRFLALKGREEFLSESPVF